MESACEIGGPGQINDGGPAWWAPQRVKVQVILGERQEVLAEPDGAA